MNARNPLPVILDTDPGVDDALAILLALRSPELQLVGITTVCGNVTVEQATRNLFKILNVVKPTHNLLVGQGASQPLKESLETATHVHGVDGLGELERFRNSDGTPRYSEPLLPRIPSALDVWKDCGDQHPDGLTLITIGPLTNLALALETNHPIVKTLSSVICMGGAVTVPGNVTPAAEFNIFSDPHAAQLVFNSELPVTLIPLDITTQVLLTREDIHRLSADSANPVLRFLGDATRHVLNFAEQVEGAATFPLHDPLAVGVASDPSLVDLTPLHVEVETEGRATKGMTVADRRAIRDSYKMSPNVYVALSVDRERFLRLFQDRLCRT